MCKQKFINIKLCYEILVQNERIRDNIMGVYRKYPAMLSENPLFVTSSLTYSHDQRKTTDDGIKKSF